MRRVLVVNPTRNEHRVFVETCAEAGYELRKMSIGRVEVADFVTLGLTVAPGGVGKAQFALQTQHLLDHGGWDAVICAGTAGGLREDLRPGAVVVGEVTVEHDYRNRFSPRPFPSFPADLELLAALRQAASSRPELDVRFGVIASGDEDVISAERRRQLLAGTGALAVAWEGAGGARAAAFSGAPFVEIRGVSDGADGAAPADFARNLPQTMRNVAALLLAWRSA